MAHGSVSPAFPSDEDRRRLVSDYLACRTIEEKRALANRLNLSPAQLYNLYSRWYVKYPA